MGCSCCCLGLSYDPAYHPHPREEPSHRTNTGRFTRSPNHASTRGGTTHCNVCGMYVHPSLIDSHREVCRMLQRQQAAQQQGQSHQGGTDGPTVHRTGSAHFDPDALKRRLPTTDEDAVVEPDDYPIEALCAICLERLRCYAFLPCGHVVCCRDCAARCDRCPMCREERAGLCFVPPNTVSQYQCKRCHCFIAPAIFDGHREVCALRMRQQQQQQIHSQANDETTQAAWGQQGAAHEGGEAARVSGMLPDRTVQENPPDSPVIEDIADSDGKQTPGADRRHSSGGGVPETTNQWSGARTPQQGQGASNSPRAPSPAANASSPTDAHRAVVPMNLCVECQRSDRHLVITLPCGHRVLCVDCVKKRSSCPVCYRDINSTLVTYE